MSIEEGLVFSKKRTNLAGDCLRKHDYLRMDETQALTILNVWRAKHNYPMHIFKKRLKSVSEKIHRDALTAQRLKRVPSIIKKLKRKYDDNFASMRLTQMQDIAGCRVIMPTLDLAIKVFEEEYIKSDLKHKRVKINDYVTLPKEDGYRSIHVIYEYRSDKNKKQYNGFLVEIQFRSQLQHIWATAVETVGFFTGQAIKSNEGEEEWYDFFKLVSSAFAIMEKAPTVPGTELSEKVLYREIARKTRELNVIAKMNHWTQSLRYFEDKNKQKKNTHYFLLELDTIQEKLLLHTYSKRAEEKALADYAHAEKKIFEKPEYDVVLVGADSLVELKRAYPNYFLDTNEFIKKLKELIRKADD